VSLNDTVLDSRQSIDNQSNEMYSRTVEGRQPLLSLVSFFFSTLVSNEMCGIADKALPTRTSEAILDVLSKTS